MTTHSKDPSMGGPSRSNPFTGELKLLLEEIRSSNPFKADNESTRDDYINSFSDFFDNVSEYEISPQESLNFWRFLRFLYSFQEPDRKTEMFRDCLFSTALYHYPLFFRQKETREQVGGIIVKLLKENDYLFKVAIDTLDDSWPHLDRPVVITPPDNESTLDLIAKSHLGGLLYEASVLRGLV